MLESGTETPSWRTRRTASRSAAHGTIVRILDRRGGLELIQEPRLADNFRFTLPLRGPTAWQSTEANYILGKDQNLSSLREENGLLELRWDGPLTSVEDKPYHVAAVMSIRLVGEEIRFEFRIENHTTHEVGEVFAPILGGCLGLGNSPRDRKTTQLVVPALTGVQTISIFHTFANMSAFGVIGPEQFYAYPDTLEMPWLELQQPRLGRGMFFGAHDPLARYKVLHLEMLPAPRATGRRATGPVPTNSAACPRASRSPWSTCPISRQGNRSRRRRLWSGPTTATGRPAQECMVTGLRRSSTLHTPETRGRGALSHARSVVACPSTSCRAGLKQGPGRA